MPVILDPRFTSLDHKYYDADGQSYPGVTEIIRRNQKTRYRYGNASARFRGSDVHENTARMDSERLMLAQGLTEENLPLLMYLYAWERFRDAHVQEFIWVEQPFIVPEPGYAGTVDRVACTADGDHLLLDIKTGRGEPWHELQLGAYALAAHLAGVTVDRIATVRLTGKGGCIVQDYDCDSAINRWEQLL